MSPGSEDQAPPDPYLRALLCSDAAATKVRDEPAASALFAPKSLLDMPFKRGGFVSCKSRQSRLLLW